jgi:uroporphyrinogen-III decarboxylase
MISPRGYQEFVLPYEKKMGEFHGGLDYWHSCGKIDPIVQYIKEIPNLKMIHLSPFTDLKKSVEIIGNDHIIEIVLNPIDDVERATPLQMEKKLSEIKSICEGLRFTVRADAFQVLTSVENDLKQIKLWIKKARKALHTP